MKKTITLLLLVLMSASASFGQWTALGPGLPGRVKAIAVYNGKIYAGGAFNTYKNVAVYNEASSTWATAGDGLSDSVSCLAVHLGNLYAGGYFKFNGSGDSLMYVAKLNASTGKWERVYTGFNNFLRCLYSDGTNLYAGGAFVNSAVTGGTVSRIAKLTANGWTNAGTSTSITGQVAAMTTHQGVLYAAGSFTGNLLTKFNTATNSWDVVSTGGAIAGQEASSLASKGTKLYIGGNFNGSFMKGLAVYNGGSSFTPPFTSLYDGTVSALLSTPTKIFGGGSFTKNTNQQTLSHFFSSSGSTPFSDNGGFNGDVLSLGNYNGYIIAGGSFTTAGGTSVSNIAKSSATIDVAEINDLVTAASVYPNPVREQATLRFTTTQPVRNPGLQIIDMQGRLVREALPSGGGNPLELVFEISREGLASGTYFFSLISSEGVLNSGKFLVQ